MLRKYLFVFLSFFAIYNVAKADIGCNAGYYESNGVCHKCAKGTYNPNANSSFCNACPATFTTVSEGAISAKECVHYVDKFYSNGQSFTWPASITPGAVDTSYLTFQ